MENKGKSKIPVKIFTGAKNGPTAGNVIQNTSGTAKSVHKTNGVLNKNISNKSSNTTKTRNVPINQFRREEKSKFLSHTERRLTVEPREAQTKSKRPTVGNQTRKTVDISSKNYNKIASTLNRNIPREPVNTTKPHKPISPISKEEKLTSGLKENQINSKRSTFGNGMRNIDIFAKNVEKSGTLNKRRDTKRPAVDPKENQVTSRRATVGNDLKKNVNASTQHVNRISKIVNRNIPKRLENSRTQGVTIGSRVKKDEEQQFLAPVFCLPEAKVEDPIKPQMENKRHALQQDIDFVPDERFRKLILNNKELTPTILKSWSSAKSQSMYERCSFFKKISISCDPHKDALKAIENANLAEEDRRVSQMKASASSFFLSPKVDRPSVYKRRCFPNNPHATALRAIRNADLAGEERRFSQLKMLPANPLLSPAKIDRPSVYKRRYFPNNPHETALRAIENADLAGEERRLSQLKMLPTNPLSPAKFERASLYRKIHITSNPHVEVLKAIENLAAEGQNSQLKTESAQLSTPLKKGKVLNSVDDFLSRQKMKSAKKVTFNLNVTDSTSKKNSNIECLKNVNLKTCLVSASKSTMKNPIFKSETIESKLARVSEEGGNDGKKDLLDPVENSTPSLAIHSTSNLNDKTELTKRKTPELSHFKNMLLRVCPQKPTDFTNKSENLQETNPMLSANTEQSNPNLFADKMVTPAVSSLSRGIDSRNVISTPANFLSSTDWSHVKSSLLSNKTVTPAASSVYREFKTEKEAFSIPRNYGHPTKKSETKHMLPSSAYCLRTFNNSENIPSSEEDQDRTSSDRTSFVKWTSKLCTPRPVSFYPRVEFTDSNTPEFFSSRTTNIISLAPINTPLVLRCMARNSENEFNPDSQRLDSTSDLIDVCQRLNFDDATKEDEDSEEITPTLRFQNIFTAQKELDNLADQECGIFITETSFPANTRPYLYNPIAETLMYGDKTNFVPIKP